jgi:hypothetical protein
MSFHRPRRHALCCIVGCLEKIVALHTHPSLNNNILIQAIEEAKRQAEEEAQGEVPTLVHCSAGVGRTGVFVACDVALQQVEAYRKVDPTGVLAHLRRARGGCIQTPAQYLYFILVARDYLVRVRWGNRRDGWGSLLWSRPLPLLTRFSSHCSWHSLRGSDLDDWSCHWQCYKRPL